MKIYLFHGDDINGLEKKYAEYVSSNTSKRISLSQEDEAIRELTERELFPEASYYYIDNLKILSKKFIEVLNKYGKDIASDLVIYQGSLVSKEKLKEIKIDITEVKCELPKEIFKFLDMIYKGRGESFVNTYKMIKDVYPTELTNFFIGNHLSDMVFSLTKTKEYNSWKSSGLISQSAKKDIQTIKKHIYLLSLLDYETKTGRKSINDIDFFVLKYLE